MKKNSVILVLWFFLLEFFTFIFWYSCLIFSFPVSVLFLCQSASVHIWSPSCFHSSLLLLCIYLVSCLCCTLSGSLPDFLLQALFSSMFFSSVILVLRPHQLLLFLFNNPVFVFAFKSSCQPAFLQHRGIKIARKTSGQLLKSRFLFRFTLYWGSYKLSHNLYHFFLLYTNLQ